MTRVFAPSCASNQAPIADVLTTVLAGSRHVLEIGSGTGQHSVYFAPRLPHLVWQTSELAAQHASICAWHAHAPSPNLRAPLLLQMGGAEMPWPHTAAGAVDAVFTSNTLHIMDWGSVLQLLAWVGQHLPDGGLLVVYGAFHVHGRATTPSNAAFDAWLQARDPASGLRDVQAVADAAAVHGLNLLAQHAMPANNLLLVWQKSQLAN